MLNIHATLISFQGKGILFRGVSGSGKSDLALRMIMQHNAVLVSDDQVLLDIKDNKVVGYAPETILGKLEIRGIGIASLPYQKSSKIDLIVDLVNINQIERLPNDEIVSLLEIGIPKINLYPFETSATYKIIAKISGFIC